MPTAVDWRPREVLGGDALKLPLRSDAFDAAICVAVMHHLSTVARRLAILRYSIVITSDSQTLGSDR